MIDHEKNSSPYLYVMVDGVIFGADMNMEAVNLPPAGVVLSKEFLKILSDSYFLRGKPI